MNRDKKIFAISAMLNVILLAITVMFFVKFDVYQIILNRFNNDEIIVTDKDFASQESLPLSDIYLGRESLFQSLPIENDDIILIGDSITQRGEWVELTGNMNVKNRGIDSDSVAGVINRIQTITQGKPKSVFINIGINDLYRGYDVESVLIDYRTLIDDIKIQSPNTKIHIQSLLPVNNSEYDHPLNNVDIQAFNTQLEKIANENNIIFIDTYSYFADENNELSKEYTEDGVHLSGEGFIKIKDILSEYF